jgi:FixJ family two-component response regulator
MTAIPDHARTEARAERVHVVDDDPAILRVVANFLGAVGVSVVCHTSAVGFLAALHPNEFGCAVIDMVLPGVERFTLLRKLGEDYPGVQVIMMSGHGDIPNAIEAVRHGAVDFLEKPLRRHRLTGLVHSALDTARAQRAKVFSARDTRSRLERLTKREFELLPMFCQGKTVKEIALNLGLSHKTVQVHRSRILERMHVDSVVELLILLHDVNWEGTVNREGRVDRADEVDWQARGDSRESDPGLG